jgi:hypothetical protein
MIDGISEEKSDEMINDVENVKLGHFTKADFIKKHQCTEEQADEAYWYYITFGKQEHIEPTPEQQKACDELDRKFGL